MKDKEKCCKVMSNGKSDREKGGGGGGGGIAEVE